MSLVPLNPVSLVPLTPTRVLVGDTGSDPVSAGHAARTFSLPQLCTTLTSKWLQLPLKNNSLKHVKVQRVWGFGGFSGFFFNFLEIHILSEH